MKWAYLNAEMRKIMNDGHPATKREGIFKGFLKLLSKKIRKEEDVTEEEIIDMVNEGHEQGVLAKNEAEMINNIFEFGDKRASDVMIHRKSIVAIDCNTTIREAFDFVMNENHTRYPVYDGDIDNILGILHLRDLIKVYVDDDKRNLDKTLGDMRNQVLFDACYIPETRKLSVLFKEMQSKKIHIALVVDEYGQTAGIISLEDIVEEIVGDILDEYDDEEVLIVKQPDDSYLLDGKMLLHDIEDMFDITFDCEDIDTINGFLINKMGKIPKDNENFQCVYEGYLFKVIEVKNRMVAKVSMSYVGIDENSEEREYQNE